MKKLVCTIIATILMISSVFAAGVNVEVNGKPIELQGTIINGRTMVPVRGIFEELGYFVHYNTDTKTATLVALGTAVVMTQGNSYFTLNKEQITPEVPPQIIDGRFMLPLRAVSEALGGQVDWDANTKTAKVTADTVKQGMTASPVYVPEN